MLDARTEDHIALDVNATLVNHPDAEYQAHMERYKGSSKTSSGSYKWDTHDQRFDWSVEPPLPPSEPPRGRRRLRLRLGRSPSWAGLSEPFDAWASPSTGWPARTTS